MIRSSIPCAQRTLDSQAVSPRPTPLIDVSAISLSVTWTGDSTPC